MKEAVQVLRDQQDGFREDRTTLQTLTSTLGQVARSLDSTVGHLTAISANVQMTQRDMEDHTKATRGAMAKVDEMHNHVMRRRG